MTGCTYHNEATDFFTMPQFIPATERDFGNEWLNPSSGSNLSFETDYEQKYVMSKHEVITPPYNLIQGVETLSSLIRLGEIVFEGSRNTTPEESAALHSYYKKKSKKLS